MKVQVNISTHIAPVFAGEVEAASTCEALCLAMAEPYVAEKMGKMTTAAWSFEAVPVGGPVQADVARWREIEARQAQGKTEPWRDEITV